MRQGRKVVCVTFKVARVGWGQAGEIAAKNSVKSHQKQQ